MTIQLKATEQYFPVVLFIMLFKVVLTFESVDEILKCDHSIALFTVNFSHLHKQDTQGDKHNMKGQVPVTGHINSQIPQD